MEELDLKSILRIVIKHWWIMLASTFFVVIAVGIFTYFFITPIYQADTTIYVGRDTFSENKEINSSATYNDLLVGSQLVNDYRELVKSRKVAERVISELGIKGINANQLTKDISVNSKQDTRVIQISAQDADPVMAKRIVDKVASVFTEMVTDVMKIENVQVIDKAELPTNPAKPNTKMNIAIAAVLGFILGVGVVFLIEYLDDSVKTPEDVQKYTNLPIIGTIPVFPNN